MVMALGRTRSVPIGAISRQTFSQEVSMTRFALILAAILAAQNAPQPPQAAAALVFVEHLPNCLNRPPQSPLWPSPRLLPPVLGHSAPEPIPAWNIHGHAEVLPNPTVRPLRVKSWKYRPTSPAPSLPRMEKIAAAATPAPPRKGTSTAR